MSDVPQMARAVVMFDPAAEFLLTMPWPNLFERASAATTNTAHRCKGCRLIVPMAEREKHFRHHKSAAARSETARQERINRERTARLADARQRRAVAA